ncbi:hypothetical protein A2954_04505 [Candidatus Roizmanbacteria bacterium RIFCSPLOWO2_01_FULL_37_12]|uniref:Uncharacterized protein n=1 Tax=Candidatus Roizmanbacteria bacterium RIFCSPLOWO2_01_FULL_37_12 TaxID=1802056 RepID=A0A1F7IFV9_9BACT|nr:MAG: hypothetical protein A3D76_06445 [Candidatus Roizmanbacteria bacterium RIFCSPHIGHO2_02_FULL_37_9b]OGK42243.1 MAG: hypothetical protein A2954_04505 [Candidatus Roizmanbacteria bacterium RIFCSPLOWO2_01_FULL_37_12]
MNELRTKPNNGQLRTISEKFKPFVEILLKKTSITADQVSFAGLGFVIGGAALKTISEYFGKDASLIAFASMFLGVNCDWVDGMVAKIRESSSNKGAMNDLMVDRWEELFLAASRVAMASLRKDSIGVVSAVICGLTGVDPSLIRAKIEALTGEYPSEMGISPAALLGSRAPRAANGIINTSWPELFRIPILNTYSQSVLDLISGVANFKLARERNIIYHNLLESGSDFSKGDCNTKELGQMKVEALTKFKVFNSLAIGLLGVAGLAYSLRHAP